MRKLLLLASLCAAAMIPTAASAHESGVLHRQVLSSFGLSIVVREAPKVVRHDFRRARHLWPQPWPRRLEHHAPRFDWHKSWRPGARHFDRHWGKSWHPGPRHLDRHWGDRRWFGGHDRRVWKHDGRRPGLHAPERRGDHAWGDRGREGRHSGHGGHDGRRR